MKTPVSFEIAKLLKEKDEIFDVTSTLDYPTIAEVVMWLYEKHRIWISVYTMETWPNGNERKQLFDYSLKQMRFGLIDISKKPEEFNSPTEAYEASIEFTLKNLI